MAGAEPEPLSLADRDEIRELIARYNWAIDTRDGVGVANTFIADGVFDGERGQLARGREELIAFGELRHRPPAEPGVGSQHWVTNLVFEGNHARVYLKSFFIRQNIDRGTVTSTNLGYYRDDLVNVDGRWLFERRRWRLWPPSDTDA
jgi:uncharacterized protein (TIGR02246 family)